VTFLSRISEISDTLQEYTVLRIDVPGGHFDMQHANRWRWIRDNEITPEPLDNAAEFPDTDAPRR